MSSKLHIYFILSLLFITIGLDQIFASCFIHIPSSTSAPRRHSPSTALYKKKFTINRNIDEVVSSSDGILEEKFEKKKLENKPQKSNLGISTKPKKKKKNNDKSSGIHTKTKMDKIFRQRMGTLSSATAAALPPEQQKVQIQQVKRGSGTVTIVRGITCPKDTQKKLLKELKGKLGGGGTLLHIENVYCLELQGSHAERILEFISKKGYKNAKIIK